MLEGGCLISTDLISERLDLQRCIGGPKEDNISCYSNGRMDGYLSKDNLTKVNCTSLFIAVRYPGNYMSQPELLFGQADVGWWMDGSVCNCSHNATCTRVNTTVAGKMGHRCTCDQGFYGDGFAAGDRCRKG